MGFRRHCMVRKLFRALCILAVCMWVCLMFYGLLMGDADMEAIRDYQPRASTWIYDDAGEPILCFAKERRTVIPLSEMGEMLPRVVIAAEDKNFYTRWGPIDSGGVWRGLTRQQGASSISGQLARNLFLVDMLEHERAIFRNISAMEEELGRHPGFIRRLRLYDSLVRVKVVYTPLRFFRKLRELALAARMEAWFGRSAVLEVYLNHVYFGDAYGVQDAGRVYFGKSPKDLALDDAALLAGLIRSPVSSSPFQDPEKARALRIRVLKRLASEKLLSEEEAGRLAEKPLPEKRQSSCRGFAPHFAEIVRRDLVKRYTTGEIWSGGLAVYTSLNRDIQKLVEESLRKSLAAVQGRRPDMTDLRGAALVLDIRSGEIKAWVEEPDISQNEYDLIVQAHRHAGSVYKAFFYALLLKKNWRLACEDDPLDPKRTSSCMLYDTEGISVPMGGWGHTIRNYPYEHLSRYLGPISLQQAIAESRNAATMSAVAGVHGSGVNPLTERVAVNGRMVEMPVFRVNIKEEFAPFVRSLGIESSLDTSLTAPLGSTGVTLFDMTRAFAMFASECKEMSPSWLVAVRNRQGKIIEERPFVPERFRCENKAHALQIIRLLRGPVEVETGTAAAMRSLGVQVMAKTGTATNNAGDATDNWFFACTTQHCFGGWIGRDKKLPLGTKETGGRNVLPVALEVFQALYKDLKPQPFPPATDPFTPFRLKDIGARLSKPANAAGENIPAD